jgi:hypothetical protein
MTTATDFSHLHALELSLFNEKHRLQNARTESEKKLRTVWVDQIEKEISDELEFLGLSAIDSDTESLSDSDLLADLGLF